MTTDTPSQYSDGYAARMRGTDLDACPYGMTELHVRHWWLAGFHDADIELGWRDGKFERTAHGR